MESGGRLAFWLGKSQQGIIHSVALPLSYIPHEVMGGMAGFEPATCGFQVEVALSSSPTVKILTRKKPLGFMPLHCRFPFVAQWRAGN